MQVVRRAIFLPEHGGNPQFILLPVVSSDAIDRQKPGFMSGARVFEDWGVPVRDADGVRRVLPAKDHPLGRWQIDNMTRVWSAVGKDRV